jgi:hypothetical protein
MTSDGSAAPEDGDTAGNPFDTSVAHQARMYDYVLGGKDNISQVVSVTPHSDRTVPIQARHGVYSKIAGLTRA